MAEPGEGGAEGVVSEGGATARAARACFRNCTIRGMRSMAAACTEVMSPPIMMTRSGGCERPAAWACAAWSYELPSAESILIVAPDACRIAWIVAPALPMMQPHASERTRSRIVYCAPRASGM